MPLKERSKWRPTAWVTLAKLAVVLDVTPRVLRRDLVGRMPKGTVRRRGRARYLYAPAAVRAWLTPDVRRDLLREQRAAAAAEEAARHELAVLEIVALLAIGERNPEP